MIKERILSVAAQSGKNRTQFFSDLGLSYANFKGRQKLSALSSDTLVKILQVYPTISPAWLVLGEGNMFRNSSDQLSGENADESLIAVWKQVVGAQEKTILSLEAHVAGLERELAILRKTNKA